MAEEVKRVVPPAEKRMMAVVIGLGVLIALLFAVVVGTMAVRMARGEKASGPIHVVLPDGATFMSASVDGKLVTISYRDRSGHIIVATEKSGTLNPVADVTERR